MGERTASSKCEKHVCIYELERKGDLLTADVVCTVCGAYLSSQEQVPAGEQATINPESRRSL
jgi:hypothetical protein